MALIITLIYFNVRILFNSRGVKGRAGYQADQDGASVKIAKHAN